VICCLEAAREKKNERNAAFVLDDHEYGDFHASLAPVTPPSPSPGPCEGPNATKGFGVA